MSRKKKLNKFKLFKFIFIILIIVVGIILIIRLLNKKNIVLMKDYYNTNYNLVKEELDTYFKEVIVTYEYNNNIEKDYIISQSIEKDKEINVEDKLELVISLGERDLKQLKEDGINELGSVPIMMYHGIKDCNDSDTTNTGGNVDKDGYTRTVESFRRDLEFYYTNGYRMIKLSDYIDGNIDVEYGYSPIILTFDDGNANNILVDGLDSNGEIIINKNSAVGVLEEFKKKYPDYNVTAIFFITSNLFNQPEYNEKILKWLVDNGYEVGNHTTGHNNFSNIDTNKTQEVVGGMYQKLESILGDKYSKIIALPFGSPYNKTHANYKYIINGTYNGVSYETKGALRVGWEPEVSPFNVNFDATFLKRCRAYDNNGKDFDIDYVFNKILKTKRYISDGDKKTIVTSKSNESIISKTTDKEIILYE